MKKNALIVGFFDDGPCQSLRGCKETNWKQKHSRGCAPQTSWLICQTGSMATTANAVVTNEPPLILPSAARDHANARVRSTKEPSVVTTPQLCLRSMIDASCHVE